MPDAETPGAAGPPPAPPPAPPPPDDDLTQDEYTHEVMQLVRAAGGRSAVLPLSFPADAARCYVLEVPVMDAAAGLLRDYDPAAPAGDASAGDAGEGDARGA